MTIRGGEPGDYDTGQAMPYVDSRIYTEHGIFEEELEKIWKRVWLACVHASEIPDTLDLRTLTIARQPVIIGRAPERTIRALANPFPHRGNRPARKPPAKPLPS